MAWLKGVLDLGAKVAALHAAYVSVTSRLEALEKSFDKMTATVERFSDRMEDAQRRRDADHHDRIDDVRRRLAMLEAEFQAVTKQALFAAIKDAAAKGTVVVADSKVDLSRSLGVGTNSAPTDRI